MYAGKDDGGWLSAIESDGDPVLTPGADGSVTLANSKIYYIPIGTDFAPLPAETSLVSVHLKWASAVAGTITIEMSNFPAKRGGRRAGPGYDVTDYDTTAGNWIQYNPASAYVPTAGASNTATAATVTAGGAAAGGCVFDVIATPARRWRVKLDITTGGALWANTHGKVD